MELLRTKKVLQVNPTVSPDRSAPVNPKIILYEYDKDNSICLTLNTIEETYEHLSTPQNTWINIDGLRKVDIENICTHFGYSSINRRRY